MKWDLLNLKKLKKIKHFVETKLKADIFIEEEDDAFVGVVKSRRKTSQIAFVNLVRFSQFF